VLEFPDPILQIIHRRTIKRTAFATNVFNLRQHCHPVVDLVFVSRRIVIGVTTPIAAAETHDEFQGRRRVVGLDRTFDPVVEILSVLSPPYCASFDFSQY
jgi:hypothetical protein